MRFAALRGTQRKKQAMQGLRLHVLLQPQCRHGGFHPAAAEGRRERGSRGMGTAGGASRQGTGTGNARPAGRIQRHGRDERGGRAPRGEGGDRTGSGGDGVPLFAAQPLPVQRFHGAHDRHVLPLPGARHGGRTGHGRCRRTAVDSPAKCAARTVRTGLHTPGRGEIFDKFFYINKV